MAGYRLAFIFSKASTKSLFCTPSINTFCIWSYHTQKPTRNTLLAVTGLQQLKLSVQREKQNAQFSMLRCTESDLTCKLNIQLEEEAQAIQMCLVSMNLDAVAEKRVCGTLWCLNNACFLLNPSSIYSILIKSKSDKTTKVCLTQNSVHCHEQWHGTEQFQQSESHQSSAHERHRAGSTAAQMFSAAVSLLLV